jgi:hypothetical protein
MRARHPSSTHSCEDAPEAHQGPGSLEQDKAELPIYDGHDRQHGRAQEIGHRIPEVGGLYPPEKVGSEGAEDGLRPEDLDQLHLLAAF